MQLTVTLYCWFPQLPDSFTLWLKLALPLHRPGVYCTAEVRVWEGRRQTDGRKPATPEG